MNEYNKRIVNIGSAIGIIGGLTGIVLGSNVKTLLNSKYTQTGFVNPNDIEIRFEDLDKDGSKETILEHEGNKYLFKIEDGKPVILEYSMDPAKIVEGTI